VKKEPFSGLTGHFYNMIIIAMGTSNPVKDTDV
jgi:hypothetical protein